ncbi:MAG: ABC transporter transmembrane domain-containing protein [Thermomicrobiales bacterium]
MYGVSPARSARPHHRRAGRGEPVSASDRDRRRHSRTTRDLNLLYLLVGLVIVLPIVSGLIGVGQSYLNSTVGWRVSCATSDRLYSHLQQLMLRFFTATRTGEIQSRISNDVNGVSKS